MGIGHIESTSLPVGGANTHAALAGHSGLPGAKLFSRLDELKKEDLFFIETCNEKLAYKVCRIQTVLPGMTKELEIEDGKDLVILITCVPYGINDHRLLVTGERYEYTPHMEQQIAPQEKSTREKTISLLPWLLCALVLFCLFLFPWLNKRRKKKRQTDESDNEIE